MPSLAWFSYVGKILKDLQFHCSQIVPDFGDIMGNRQVSLPNSSACHFLFVTQWYCSKGWQLSHSSFYPNSDSKSFHKSWMISNHHRILGHFLDIFWENRNIPDFPNYPRQFSFFWNIMDLLITYSLIAWNFLNLWK